MIGDQHRPVTLGRGPIQRVAIHGEWNGIAVLVHRSRAHRSGRQLLMKGRASGTGIFCATSSACMRSSGFSEVNFPPAKPLG
jgi:hypothetical protein